MKKTPTTEDATKSDSPSPIRASYSSMSSVARLGTSLVIRKGRSGDYPPTSGHEWALPLETKSLVSSVRLPFFDDAGHITLWLDVGVTSDAVGARLTDADGKSFGEFSCEVPTDSAACNRSRPCKVTVGFETYASITGSAADGCSGRLERTDNTGSGLTIDGLHPISDGACCGPQRLTYRVTKLDGTQVATFSDDHGADDFCCGIAARSSSQRRVCALQGDVVTKVDMVLLQAWVVADWLAAEMMTRAAAGKLVERA